MKKNNSEIIDIAGIMKTYASKWYWFVISIVCCCAIGFLFSKTIKPEYEVRANIMLSDDTPTSKLMAGGISGVSDLLGSNSNVTDELEIMMSHTILRNVAKTMGLHRSHVIRTMPMVSRFAYQDYPIEVVPDESINIDTLKTTISFKVKINKKGVANVKVYAGGKEIDEHKDLTLPSALETPFGKFSIMTTPEYRQGKEVSTAISFTNYDNAAESLRASVNAGLASKRSQIISLQMVTDDRNYAIDVLNTLMAKYNERSSGVQEEQTSATASFLDGRINSLRGNLSQIEGEIANYKESNNIADLKQDGAVIYERMKDSEHQRQEAEINLRLLEITLDMVRESAKDNSIIPVQNDPNLAALITEYNRMILRRMRMEESARKDNPALVSLDEQIKVSRNNLIASVQTALAQQRKTVAEFSDIYDTAISQVSGIPAQEKTFYAMERDRQIQEQIYLYLLQKQEETSIFLSNISPKGVIIDEAYSINEDKSLPTPMILLISFIIGLLIPPMVWTLRKLFRRKFDSIKEVEDKVELPILGEICQDKSGEHLVVTPGRHSSTAELFRLVRVNLQFVMSNPGDKVVLITSTNSGEGKSFISVNVAASLAAIGKRTLLIGMDIRNPRLVEYIGVKPQFGLTQYLSGSSRTIGDLIMRDAIKPGLDLIVAGPIPANPAEMLAGNKVDELFEELRERYDYIIIDAAPVGMVSDAFLLNRLSDVTIYVVRANYTNISDLDFAQKLSDTGRLKRMSIVVNGTKTHAAYGYGYGEDVFMK